MTESLTGDAEPLRDEQWFADWIRPHLPAMARLAARLAGDADRDDVVQEALTRAWSKRRQYRAGRGTPSAWLLAITADQARKAARRRRLRSVLSLADAAGARIGPVAGGAPGGAAADAETRLDVERAVRTLPTRQRLAVDCYYFADLSVADTAAVMGCSEGTVKSTLSDARARLRDLLEVPR